MQCDSSVRYSPHHFNHKHNGESYYRKVEDFCGLKYGGKFRITTDTTTITTTMSSTSTVKPTSTVVSPTTRGTSFIGD